MINLLLAIRDILVLVKEGLVLFFKAQRKQEARKVLDDSTRENSQEPIEKHIAGSSGNPTKHDYLGLRTRERKKRS